MLIDREKRVHRAAKTMMDLLTSTNWKDGVCEEYEVRIFPDRAAAEAELEFIEIKIAE